MKNKACGIVDCVWPDGLRNAAAGSRWPSRLLSVLVAWTLPRAQSAYLEHNTHYTQPSFSRNDDRSSLPSNPKYRSEPLVVEVSASCERNK